MNNRDTTRDTQREMNRWNTSSSSTSSTSTASSPSASTASPTVITIEDDGDDCIMMPQIIDLDQVSDTNRPYWARASSSSSSSSSINPSLTYLNALAVSDNLDRIYRALNGRTRPTSDRPTSSTSTQRQSSNRQSSSVVSNRQSSSTSTQRLPSSNSTNRLSSSSTASQRTNNSTIRQPSRSTSNHRSVMTPLIPPGSQVHEDAYDDYENNYGHDDFDTFAEEEQEENPQTGSYDSAMFFRVNSNTHRSIFSSRQARIRSLFPTASSSASASSTARTSSASSSSVSSASSTANIQEENSRDIGVNYTDTPIIISGTIDYNNSSNTNNNNDDTPIIIGSRIIPSRTSGTSRTTGTSTGQHHQYARIISLTPSAPDDYEVFGYSPAVIHSIQNSQPHNRNDHRNDHRNAFILEIPPVATSRPSNRNNPIRIQSPDVSFPGFSEQITYEQAIAIADRLGSAANRGASKDCIQALPKYTVSQAMIKTLGKNTDSNSGSNSANSLGECLVCMEDMKVKTVVNELPCKHYFHAKCISKWLTRNASCPKCRGPVRETIKIG